MKKCLALVSLFFIPLLLHAQMMQKGGQSLLRHQIGKNINNFVATPGAEKVVLTPGKNLTLKMLNQENPVVETDMQMFINNRAEVDKLFSSLINDPYHSKIAARAHIPLNESAFSGALIRANREKDFLYRAEYVARLKFVQENATEIARFNRPVLFSEGTPVNYDGFIPNDIKLLFVGESHSTSQAREELFLLLEQLRERDPSRKIILMTEFVDKSIESSTMLRKALETRHGLKIVYYRNFMKRLSDNNIEIVGLEDLRSLFSENVFVWFHENRDTKFHSSRPYTEKRNRAWAEIIKKHRKKNPGALVVVFTGAGHNSYSWLDNLPSLVPANESYNINLISPNNLKYVSPFWDYLYSEKEQLMWEQFNESKGNKLLMISFNKKYRKIVGADATVVLHNAGKTTVKIPFRNSEK